MLFIKLLHIILKRPGGRSKSTDSRGDSTGGLQDSSRDERLVTDGRFCQCRQWARRNRGRQVMMRPETTGALMRADSPNWVSLGDPASPAEAAAQDAFRELLDDDGMTKAWANLSFVDDAGRLA